MAIKQFVAIDQMTIWDVVLNTYGTVNDVVRLMQDNDFPNANTYPVKGQVFLFDDTLIENQNNIQSNLSTKKFSTRDRTSTNEENMIKYEADYQIDYTSNADGTTVIVLTDLAGLNARIVSVEKEIKPLEKEGVGWSWNANSNTLTLLNGNTVDNGQTLFILYSIIKTN